MCGIVESVNFKHRRKCKTGKSAIFIIKSKFHCSGCDVLSRSSFFWWSTNYRIGSRYVMPTTIIECCFYHQKRTVLSGILGTALGAYWYSRVISRWKSRQKVLLEENELDEYEKSTTASEGDGSSVDAKNEDRRVIAV